MKKIITLAWNEILVEFSDKWTLVFFAILPIVFTAILGTSMGGGGEQTVRLPINVVQEDRSSVSDYLIRQLQTKEELVITMSDRQEAEMTFNADNSLGYLVIPAGFGDALQNGEVVDLEFVAEDQSSNVLTLQQAIRGILSQVDATVGMARASVDAAENLRAFESPAARTAYFEESLNAAIAAQETPAADAVIESTNTNRPRIATGFEQSSPGQLVTWTLTTLLAASVVFVSERRGGTLRRLLTTPTSKAALLSGKIIGRLAIGLAQMALLIIVGGMVFGVYWGESPLALALLVLAFGLAAVALGVMLAAFLKTPEQANGISIMGSLLLASLGGAWWPLEVTPPLYQTVVQVLPSTWAMQGFLDLIVRGQGLTGVLPEIGILLGFALIFFAIGVWRLRFE